MVSLPDTLEASLEKINSSIHGFGVRTTVPIYQKRIVVLYDGTLIKRREKCGLLNKYKNKGIVCLYMMASSRGLIDATENENIAKFINHSCDPNCFIVKFAKYGYRVFIVARRKILPFEELTVDYRLSCGLTLTECHCQSSKCRGFLENPGSKLGKQMLKMKKAEKLRLDGQFVMDFEEIAITISTTNENVSSSNQFDNVFREDIEMGNSLFNDFERDFPDSQPLKAGTFNDEYDQEHPLPDDVEHDFDIGDDKAGDGVMQSALYIQKIRDDQLAERRRKDEHNIATKESIQKRPRDYTKKKTSNSRNRTRPTDILAAAIDRFQKRKNKNKLTEDDRDILQRMCLLNKASKACIALFQKNKKDSQEIIKAKDNLNTIMYHFPLKYELLYLLVHGSDEQKGILSAALETIKDGKPMEFWSRLAADETLFNQWFSFDGVKVLQKYYD